MEINQKDGLTKHCPGCKETKLHSEYQKNRCTKDGLQYHCKVCRQNIDSRLVKRAYDRNRYHTQKETTYLNPRYKKQYGITLDQYNERLHNQNNVCAICKNQCKSGRRLAVDHCHKTGKVRGLLCSACNQTLGKFQDNIERFENAANYLRTTYGSN